MVDVLLQITINISKNIRMINLTYASSFNKFDCEVQGVNFIWTPNSSCKKILNL